MDDATMRRLAAYIAEALAPLIQPRTSLPNPNYRLSNQALEQRRAAARASAERRAEALAAPKPKRKRRNPSTNPERNVPAETTGSTESVNGPQTESVAPTTQAFLRYAAAFKLRYGTFPVRNAKVNGMLAQFIRRVPHDEAPDIAAFYVESDKELYVRASHCIDLLLRDAEAVRMEWATGRKAVPKVNGSHVTTVSKAWWETWPTLKKQGDELGIEEGDNPTVYRFEVLRAAYKAGRLPEEIAVKLRVADG